MKTKKWSHSLLAKIIAFFLLVIMACTTFGCAMSGFILIDKDFYTRSVREIKEDAFYPLAFSAGRSILYEVLNGNAENAWTYCGQNNLSAVVTEENAGQLWSNYSGAQTAWKFTMNYDSHNTYNTEQLAGKTYTVQLHLYDEFPEQSDFSFINALINLGFLLRYWIYAIGILALILTISSFIFLMCSAGHKPGQEEVTANGLTKVPFDLLSGLLFLAALMVIFFVYDNYAPYNDVATIILLAVTFVVAVSVGTAYCMHFAVRVKLGGWWRNTVLYRLVMLAIRICKAMGHGLAALVRNLPLIWKTIVFVLAVTATEFFALVVCFGDTEILLVFWLLEKAMIVPVVLYLALVLRKLQKGSQALARGDLSYQVDTRRMFWDFKQHGENLNSIGVGMTHAVNDRLKSERFKTELITNVSHDIKTPLTSIINYSDLICKEQTENEKVMEYATVLLRQSERLKKLIEDLVEASKASTGNVDVLLAPCETGVLLTQTVGEYEQRLRENNLELITKQPEAPVSIMADGRHLWRVFDNLLNNICKYAQEGTRVYLSVEEKNQEAIISFKNTSKYPLDISTEELMERFVRGDSSRNTDGNGLGLSIAQSLTELQNGKLALTVDGDLFKVILRFNCIA